jgi:predicted aminopeptidase
MQAIRGQFEVMHSRQPIPEVIADEASPDDLKQRLKIVQAARDFAVDELLLPDNKSYRSYADLERDYVVWNVFAAPEFSLDPKTWCYPVAGCVAYRGYFAEDAARKKAQRLQDDGFDVAVGGVAAYSTLGRFSDPVLNTMMRWSDVELVSTIFHELAHQKLYVKGDTEFNESFATAVADIGITRWLDGRDESASAEIFRKNRELRQSMMMLVEESKAKLSELYESELDDDVKRLRKQELLDSEQCATGIPRPVRRTPGRIQDNISGLQRADRLFLRGSEKTGGA